MCDSRMNMVRTAELLRSLLLILNCYSRPEHPVPTIGTFFPGRLECRSAVPAQAACLLPGTPNSPSQAHRRCPLFFAVMVSILQLERGIDDCQTRDPHRLASRGVQAVLAVEVAVGKTAHSGKSSPADCAHGAGEAVKLGILVSARTVRAYRPYDADPRGRRRTSSQH